MLKHYIFNLMDQQNKRIVSEATSSIEVIGNWFCFCIAIWRQQGGRRARVQFGIGNRACSRMGRGGGGSIGLLGLHCCLDLQLTARADCRLCGRVCVYNCVCMCVTVYVCVCKCVLGCVSVCVCVCGCHICRDFCLAMQSR